MKATNKHKATITLGLVSLGFAVSYPFGHSFIGGLLASGFSSAMIGGLADWFAVSAFFRRPLGIPFRTELIPRNRQRITEAIITMVESELLTRDNIRETINRYDIAGLVVRYLNNYGGKARLSQFFAKIGDDLISQINAAKAGGYLAEIISANAGRIKLAPLLAQTLEWTVRNGFADKLATFLLAELQLLVAQPPVKELFTSLFAEARVVYERDLTRRKFASQFLEGLGFTTSSMAALGQQETSLLLGQLQDADHPWRQALRQRSLAFAERLNSDEALQARVEEAKNAWLVSRADLADKLTVGVEYLRKVAAGEGGQEIIHRWLDSQATRLVAAFSQSTGQQQVVGDLLRRTLFALIDAHHPHIGKIVRERLDQYSTADMVDLIESRVGNDLQMIRINGSIVGGLTGMLIFLFAHLL
jgi:uncharacterized membrane-anchored protein YjiN (DUF445 family)